MYHLSEVNKYEVNKYPDLAHEICIEKNLDYYEVV